MKLAVEEQLDEVADALRARIAMVRPVLRATLFALSVARTERLGGRDAVTLADLAREYREGAGDCGICFEFAVHDAIERRDPLISPRVSEVLDEFCRITGPTRSILFGAEKGERLPFLSDPTLLTDESRLVVGTAGNPPKLKQHLARARRAFSQPRERERLPRSIRGLWRADLFVGSTDQQRWVATTLKTNPAFLEGDAGIRLGIFPEVTPGQSPAFDVKRNLVLCPLAYDAGFMEAFYGSFFTVKSFLDADARLPKPIDLPASVDRSCAMELERRRGFAVLDVIASLESLAQPGLLQSSFRADGYPTSPTNAIAPVPRKTR